MNKTELITAVAADTSLTQVQVKAVIESTLGLISSSLANKEEVAIVGFGTFTTKTRAARTGRNPKTGEELQIAEAVLPVFKAGKALKSTVNGE